MSSPFVRPFTVLAALVAWGAVLLQLVLSLHLAVENGRGVVFGVVVYFGYFTILTNLLVAVSLSAPLVGPGSALGRFVVRPDVATTVATAIVLVGLAYHVLLRRTWDPQGWQLVADVTLHYVTPVLFLVYWLFGVPKRTLGWGAIPKGLLYPLGYFIYVLLRGAVTGLYPYPFIDVSALGYGVVVVNGLGLLVAFLVVAALLVAGARRSGARVPVGG
jgi:hypothetical protein